MSESHPLLPSVKIIMEKLSEMYWMPLYNYLKKKPELIPHFTAFLLNREQLVFYFGTTHLGIEYLGKERVEKFEDEVKIKFTFFDYTLLNEDLLEKVIGFDYKTAHSIPLPPFIEDLLLPTDAGYDKLFELKWNFAAQSSILGFNAKPSLVEGQFTRIVNGLFFDADETGLKSRHIKWIDFVPLTIDSTEPDIDKFLIDLGAYEKLFEHDATYVYPIPSKGDFKYYKLPRINRFVELAGSMLTSEPQLTAFLAEVDNQFILRIGFFGIEIHHQLTCKWQSESKDPIKPDFFIVGSDGYANIVEFKLPHLKSNTVVGITNRETFSAELNSYISQTRTYKSYFDDPNNRKWVETKYNIKVYSPKRILVVGRRWDFSSDIWKEIVSDYQDFQIMTYDDLIDGVVAQFYLP